MAFDDEIKSVAENLATGTARRLFMPKKAETPISTWKEFKDWIETMTKTGKHFWYRGQGDATWKLDTTYHREARKTGITIAQYLSLINTGGDVHYNVCSRLNEHINMTNRLDFASCLALLRNHGFPTPLLDWTLSPYIAMFFAFRECDDIKPLCRQVKVYVFDCDSWRSSFHQSDAIDDPNQHVSVVKPYAKWNPRQIIQNTVYTVTNVDNIEGHIMINAKSEEQDYLFPFTFSADIRKEVKRELDLMGINEMTMFPDMDGLCREMKRRHFPV